MTTITALRSEIRFAGATPPPPKISVWNPPYYDPKIFEKDPDSQSKRQATGIFTRYNQRVPIVKAAADDLCGKLLKKKDAPAATLYPCPNPMAVNDITIEIPLGPGTTDAERKAAAEVEKAKMLAVLRTVRGMHVSANGENNMYLYKKEPYAVHVIIEMTEEEALRLDTYA